MPMGKPFEKGNKIGRGRPPVPPDLKGITLLSKEQVKRAGSKLLAMSIKDLKAHAKDPATSALEAAIASIILKAHSYGDAPRMEFILSRIVGKVKDEVEVAVKVEMPTPEKALEILQADYAVLPAGDVKVEELE